MKKTTTIKEIREAVRAVLIEGRRDVDQAIIRVLKKYSKTVDGADEPSALKMISDWISYEEVSSPEDFKTRWTEMWVGEPPESFFVDLATAAGADAKRVSKRSNYDV